ncbi:hypothetical protein [Winogradskyella sp. 3972H.M.0a.05]|uniref:hypothetical protein n=1 Tax=Winogradskyella sp. 3972H.M.0a.05 TaxID=2950277 RepID=UPI0033983CD9
MKRFLLFSFVIIPCLILNAQVGIGNTDPKASLDISASNVSNPLETDGLLIPRLTGFPSTSPGADQNSMLIYLTTSVGPNSPGFYYWNQGSSSWEKLLTTLSVIEDHDFYEEGTTNAPTNINSDKFTFGNMAIGKNNASYKLDVVESTLDRTINVTNSATSGASFAISGLFNIVGGNVTNNSSQRGIYNLLSGNGNNPKMGVYNNITGTGTSTNRYGTYNELSNNSESSDYGIYNTITSSSNGSNRAKIGTYNTINNSGTSDNFGVYNTLNGTSTRPQTGVFNWIISSTNAQQYGVRNILGSGGSTGSQYAVFNEFNGLSNAFQIGMLTSISNNGDGNKIGVSNQINGSGNGNHTGLVNNLQGVGTGTKTGIFTSVNPSAGGTHFGIVSSALKTGSFSGFFIGSVSIGTEPYSSSTPNNYIFPASRGTNDQIMQTDGMGNLSWIDLPNTNFWSRSGTELDVLNSGDDIHFNSDQTSITFAQSTGTPSPMIYMFDGGFTNSDKMVIAHSTAFGGWGLEYEDVEDSFIFKGGATERVEIDLNNGFPLRVYGTARAVDFQSDTTTYPDYVFEAYYEGASSLNNNYSFKTLKEVEQFIKAKGHLPGVKSYEEVKVNGMVISLSETSIKNLEKIEELFLYAIELRRENEELKENYKQLEERLARLEALMRD